MSDSKQIIHDGNTPHCGCDCEGCLGLIPHTRLWVEVGQNES